MFAGRPFHRLILPVAAIDAHPVLQFCFHNVAVGSSPHRYSCCCGLLCKFMIILFVCMCLLNQNKHSVFEHNGIDTNDICHRRSFGVRYLCQSTKDLASST